MAHEKAFGICDNKCLVPVVPVQYLKSASARDMLSGRATATLDISEDTTFDFSKYNYVFLGIHQERYTTSEVSIHEYEGSYGVNKFSEGESTARPQTYPRLRVTPAQNKVEAIVFNPIITDTAITAVVDYLEIPKTVS